MTHSGQQPEQETSFLGEFEYAVDAQRRVAIPSHWRRLNSATSPFFLLPGREKSLQLVPAGVFWGLTAKLRRVSFADAKAAVALAALGSKAQECVCDAQGRISLTPLLMQHAGIEPKGKVLLLGAITTIQIWEPCTWRTKEIDSNACLDAIQAIQEKPDDLGSILKSVSGTVE